ncbi:CD79A protein, partial [Amia calva]|nr:CD79A protein [Amia calva]
MFLHSYCINALQCPISQSILYILHYIYLSLSLLSLSAVDSNKLHYECTTAIWKDVVKLERDAPSVRVVLGQTAILSCCYSPLIPECNKTSTTTPTSNPCPSVQWTWIRRETHNSSSCGNMTNDNRFTMWVEWLGPRQICGKLTIRQSHYNDSQLYRCKLEDNNSIIFSHGTYLRVYVPIPRLLSLNEDTKNSLLKAQGILLMLCVLLPGAALLCKVLRCAALRYPCPPPPSFSLCLSASLHLNRFLAQIQIQRCTQI